MATPRKKFRPAVDDAKLLDRCHAAYRDEFKLWRIDRSWSGAGYDRYVLLRLPVLDIAPPDPLPDEPVELTRVVCEGAHSYTDAELWLDAYRGRASMRAALEAL